MRKEGEEGEGGGEEGEEEEEEEKTVLRTESAVGQKQGGDIGKKQGLRTN